jgi:hypothetical protein
MRRKSITRYRIILISAFAALSAYAHSNKKRPNGRKIFRLRLLKRGRRVLRLLVGSTIHGGSSAPS